MLTQYFNIFLIYFTIGFGVSLFYFFVLKGTSAFGRFWTAMIIGVIGSFIGGLFELFLSPIIEKLSNFNNVNIFPPILTSFIFLWIFSKANSSRKNQRTK